MAITDELREWCVDRVFMGNGYAEVLGIADRIDTEHRSALEKLAAQVDESEDGWVRLPLDADGVPIRVGERVQLIGNDPSTVSHMSLADDGWRVHVKYDGGLWTGSGEPSRIRHHCAQTVEDVLREFAREIDADAYGITDAKVAEFAAKLQLREDS